MADTKLKPCPFCGGEAHFVNNDNWIACGDCGAETSYFDTKEEATEAWNRRANDG